MKRNELAEELKNWFILRENKNYRADPVYKVMKEYLLLWGNWINKPRGKLDTRHSLQKKYKE